MPIVIDVKTKVLSGRDGSKENPFVSGGILFEASVTGAEGGIKLIWTHGWVTGGWPIKEHLGSPEMWYGTDGMALTPSFHPTKKTALSMVRINVWQSGHPDEDVALDRWVMAATDEPVDTWPILCDDGRHKVNKDELKWLQDNKHIYYEHPIDKYNGTVAQLTELLKEMSPGPGPDIPIEPPNPYPDGKMTLQMCYSPVHGFDYDVIKAEVRDPEPDILEIKSLGAKTILLWYYTQHLFHGLSNFRGLNDTAYAWYSRFLEICAREDIAVVGKLPFWGLPGWFSLPGVPDPDSAMYWAHLEAKRMMARRINGSLRPGHMVLGNEPGLMCTVYPNGPVVDEPDKPQPPRHDPSDILKITIDMIQELAPAFDCACIGPALSGAISKVAPAGSYMEPKLFLRGLAPTLVEAGIQWCGVNAYQLNVFSVPTYANYGRFYEELAAEYALWVCEEGVARKNVPTDSGLKAHLEAMIEQTGTFSPHLFSYFIYRDFNPDGWGIRHKDGSLDARAGVLRDRFGGEVPVTTYSKMLPVRVRSDHNIDAGIQIMHEESEVVDIRVEFYRAVGGWDPEVGDFDGTSLEGDNRGMVEFKLGPSNPVAFNVWRDLGFKKVDAVIVKSNRPVGGLAIWVTDAQGKWNYAGMPALT